MKTTSKNCPECNERLSVDADRCGACGWKAPGAREKRGVTAPRHNMTCTWHSGGLSCRYPVALFRDQDLSGWCMFHRAAGEGIEAARIARDSRDCLSAGYVERAKRLTYGDGSDNPNVAKLRAQLKFKAAGGNVGLFATSVLGPPQDEPGERG